MEGSLDRLFHMMEGFMSGQRSSTDPTPVKPVVAPILHIPESSDQEMMEMDPFSEAEATDGYHREVERTEQSEEFSGPEALRIVDVQRLCREQLGVEKLPLAPKPEDAGDAGSLSLALFARREEREDLSFPQAGTVQAELRALHDHVASTDSLEEVFRPSKVGPSFFFRPGEPKMSKFSVVGSYRSHSAALGPDAPSVEPQLGKHTFPPFLEAQEKLARAALQVASNLEVFQCASTSALAKALGLDEVPPEVARICESSALATDHLLRLLVRLVANCTLAKRDQTLRGAGPLTQEHKVCCRVAPFGGKHLCSNMPVLALKRQVDLHQFPSYKKGTSGKRGATSGPVQHQDKPGKKQRRKGGSGQQGQSQSTGQGKGAANRGKQPFRGGNRGGNARGRGRGQSSQRGDYSGAKPAQ